MAYLKVCPVEPDLMDYYWNYIIFEFQMNYTTESVRQGYFEQKRQYENTHVSDDVLNRLGYK